MIFLCYRLNSLLLKISSGIVIRNNTVPVINKHIIHLLVFSYTTNNVPLGAKSVETISSIFTDSDITDGKIDNAVIINIDKGQIEQQLLNRFDGVSLVADNSGQVIFSSSNDTNNTRLISKTPYFLKILSSDKKNNSFNIELDNDLKIVTYAKNYMSGFYIINIKSFNSITKSIRAIGTI